MQALGWTLTPDALSQRGLETCRPARGSVAIRPTGEAPYSQKGPQFAFRKSGDYPLAPLLPRQERLKNFGNCPVQDTFIGMAWSTDRARFANEATLSKAMVLLALHLFITIKS
jgi:hypothetical protein